MLWLCDRPAAAAPSGPLAWEPPYAEGAALERAKRQKKKKKIVCPLRNDERLKIFLCLQTGKYFVRDSNVQSVFKIVFFLVETIIY